MVRACLFGWAMFTGFCAMAFGAEGKPILFSPVSEAPEWRLLDGYQGTITRGQFEERLHRIFDPSGALQKYLQWGEDGVEIFRDPARTQSLFQLRFARPESAPSSSSVSFSLADPQKPLLGQVICLDPGHIGGDWADIEERTFRIGRDRPVVEGELNLQTCRLLAERLTAAGAKVVWTHEGFQPTTEVRPADLYPEAIQYLLQDPLSRRMPRYSVNGLIRWNAELLFYRSAEIQARARRVNEELRPDFTLCLHYNAAPWGPTRRASLRSINRLVLFAHGSYTANELAYDDQKFHLLRKLLENSSPDELEISAAIARQFQEKWGFRAEDCAGSGYAHASGVSPYVWHRNLIANRLFRGPVIFVEGPYMNDRTMYGWIQAGQYEGTRRIGGRERQNIFQEYADRVADGILERFRNLKGHSPTFTNYSP
ncbi:MAG: N-acetylmuramoyl-L-alanine amidase [Verrucomicrobia bacterium]|nr:N-acetylmuramoyl-L-alanine amidase [Verrucomicrobiota bacterium]